MKFAPWEKKVLMFSAALSLVLGLVLIPETQGFGSVMLFLGLIVMSFAPLFMIAIAQELIRSLRQTRRVTAWADVCDLRENKTRTAAERRKRFVSILKSDIFAGYTTLTYQGRTFYHDPKREAAYFKAQAERDDAMADY